MRKLVYILSVFVILSQNVIANSVDTLRLNPVGKVVVYHPEKVPNAFVLFISGDGGWNQGVIEMAGHIVSQGAMVVGINIVQYLKNVRSMKSSCFYSAGDFEEISMTIQKKYKFSQYEKPILIGYSSGATLVYGALAQAPANTFKGSIAIGFCPDIEIDKPLCRGAGLPSHVLKEGKSYFLDSCPNLTAPFIALNGTIDQICNYEDTKRFIESMNMAEIISLPNVGHGFSVVKNWLSQFMTAYEKIKNEPDYSSKMALKNQTFQQKENLSMKSDLPIIPMLSKSENDMPLAFFISGDGGWTSFDHSICDKLAEDGMPVVGLDAQKYFWNEKTPPEAANDFSQVIRYYMQLWNKKSFVLLGYSFGACVAPFIVNNFPDELKRVIKGVYCFSPDLTGDFEIHISDMLHLKNNERYNVPDGLKQVSVQNLVCVFGSEEEESLKSEFSKGDIRIETLPGSHHYNNDFNAVANIVMKDFLQKSNNGEAK